MNSNRGSRYPARAAAGWATVVVLAIVLMLPADAVRAACGYSAETDLELQLRRYRNGLAAAQSESAAAETAAQESYAAFVSRERLGRQPPRGPQVCTGVGIARKCKDIGPGAPTVMLSLGPKLPRSYQEMRAYAYYEAQRQIQPRPVGRTGAEIIAAVVQNIYDTGNPQTISPPRAVATAIARAAVLAAVHYELDFGWRHYNDTYDRYECTLYYRNQMAALSQAINAQAARSNISAISAHQQVQTQSNHCAWGQPFQFQPEPDHFQTDRAALLDPMPELAQPLVDFTRQLRVLFQQLASLRDQVGSEIDASFASTLRNAHSSFLLSVETSPIVQASAAVPTPESTFNNMVVLRDEIRRHYDARDLHAAGGAYFDFFCQVKTMEILGRQVGLIYLDRAQIDRAYGPSGDLYRTFTGWAANYRDTFNRTYTRISPLIDLVGTF